MGNALDTYDKLELEPVDSKINVIISKDKLEAFLNIEPPNNGGLKPDLESIENELAKNNIVYGLNKKLLLDISKEPQYNKDVLVAHGLKRF